MIKLACIRRLNVATLSTVVLALVLLAAPLPGMAQDETVPGEEQQSEPAPAVRKVFVSDKLVLNVYSEPDQAGSRVATIETGDAVDELERDQGFVRVRLTDGREGWVGANYLTTDAPAAVQLRDLQRQQKSASQSEKKSADEIARLRKENEALQAQVKDLKAAAAAEPAPDDGVLEGPSPTPQQLAAVAPPPSSSTAWIWSLVLVLSAGIAYAAGYQTLARRIRRKFGGLRIY